MGEYMKFTISRDKLLKLLQPLINIADKRQNLPVLANVLISVENSQISLICSDLEVELLVSETLSGGVSNGEVTVPAKKFFDICRSLPEKADVDCSLEGDKFVLKSGRSRFVLATLPAADFPTVQSISHKISARLPQKVLKGLIEKSQFAMANQDVRYYLNGMLFESDRDSLKMIATDGHRLAVSTSKEAQLEVDAPFHVILPRKAVSELVRLLQDTDATVEIQLDDHHARIKGDHFIFMAKLIDGRFPDYNKVLPKAQERVIEVDRDRLKSGLLRAAILSSEKHRGVRLQLAPGWLRIFANNPEQEEAEEEIELAYEGDEFEIGFNASYLLDVLNTVDSGAVRLTLNDPSTSALIQGHAATQQQENLYVVMPLRL